MWFCTPCIKFRIDAGFIFRCHCVQALVAWLTFPRNLIGHIADTQHDSHSRRSTAARVAAVDLGCNKFYSSWHFSQCAGLGKMNIETSRLVFLHFEAPHRFCHYPVEISLSHVNFGRGCILSARRRKQPTARGRRVRDCPLCPRRLTTHKKKRMDFNGDLFAWICTTS